MIYLDLHLAIQGPELESIGVKKIRMRRRKKLWLSLKVSSAEALYAKLIKDTDSRRL